ncbi:hypothetical protein [Ponticoccus alexandrii]|uniref:Uncharacterized protein n=1 Tax=Ponticoccus alexandrii TaxID=1943633 RepID=A0ABX7F927_9RHOB|nr:hypothetical protein [Ponticoccus alexandrii]QRF66629.1 hypothetical protein GQA70_10110 [Ponticoccus alexandrii]
MFRAQCLFAPDGNLPDPGPALPVVTEDAAVQVCQLVRIGGTGQRVCISGGYAQDAGCSVMRSRQRSEADTPGNRRPATPFTAPFFGRDGPGMQH